MDLALIVSVQVLYAIATLVIISAGLAVIFGMMRVINLAHGEFLMLGAYSAIFATKAGINIWIAMLVVAPICVGLFGIVVERLIIRHLYGRMVDTMLATWGLSLLCVGLVTSFIGNTTSGVSTPDGSFSIGAYSVSFYTMALIVIAVLLLFAIRWVLRSTGFDCTRHHAKPCHGRCVGHQSHTCLLHHFCCWRGFVGLGGWFVGACLGRGADHGCIFHCQGFHHCDWRW